MARRKVALRAVKQATDPADEAPAVTTRELSAREYYNTRYRS